MSVFPQRIPIKRLIGSDSLFGRYAAHDGGEVSRLVGRFKADTAAWKRPHARRADAAATARLAARLTEYNRALGISADLVERIAGIADGATRVVATGQQPGVLGGPLMTLHKIETARALAEHVERSQGVPCVGLYWMGADDADFAEIRELVLLGADHHALSTSLPTDAHEPAMPVGNIAAERLAQLWDGLDAFVAGSGKFPGAASVSEAVSRAIADGADHAGVTARIVAALTGGRVVVVDAREPMLREAAREMILAYFDREDEVKASVAAHGEMLEAAGLHAQLSLGTDSGVFLLENGRRTKVPAERRGEARARLDSRIADAYPGVVLRNLVQDVVFDPVAVVLGPAEVAYRAQIRGVYDLFDVASPVIFPRLFGTFAPPEVAALVAQVGVDPALLAVDPAGLAAAVFASQSDPAMEAARAKLDGAFDDAVAGFVDAVGDAGLDAAALVKTKKRLADVRRRLSQATSSVADVGRARSLQRWPFLEHVSDAFQRRGAGQERYLSMLTPFLFLGDGAEVMVRGAAAAHVEAALDGRVEHVVYSS